MQGALASSPQAAALRRMQTAARTQRRRAQWVTCQAGSTAQAVEPSVKLPATHLQASQAALTQLKATKGVNRESCCIFGITLASEPAPWGAPGPCSAPGEVANGGPLPRGPNQ